MQQPINNKQTEPVFTPLAADRKTRLCFKQSDVIVLSGSLDVRGVGKKARVRIGADMYDVYGCACDLPGCECDAYIVSVPPEAAA
jgi:hypothetical protein